MTEFYRRAEHFQADRIVDLCECGVIIESNGEREHVSMRREKLQGAKVGHYLMTSPKTGLRWIVSEKGLTSEYERV